MERLAKRYHKPRIYTWLIAISVGLMAAVNCDAQSKVFTLDASTGHLPIDTKIEYLIESEPLTREQVASDELAALWHPLNQKAFRSIPHPAPIWVRFNAINTSSKSTTPMIT